MRTLTLMLSLMLLSSPESCRAASPTTADHLKVNSNGTATVTGVVLENSHACEVDARCFLRLRVAEAEVVVVYGPAEGETATHVRNTPQEWEIKKGDHVEAYGRLYRDKENLMEVYSSEDFYVHLLNQLKVNSNGTATVTGIVLENNNGCARDLWCYLRIQAGNREVWVVYNPGESSDRVNNDEAPDIAGKVKKDAHVEA